MGWRMRAGLICAAALCTMVLSTKSAWAQKQDAAVAPVSAIGQISEGEKSVMFNALQEELGRTYRIITQAEYRRAEERAFRELEAAQCTEDACVRKIQEFLQVERLIVLQVIREQMLTQLSLTLYRGEQKATRTHTCAECTLAALVPRIGELAGTLAAEDTGRGQPPVAAAPMPAARESLTAGQSTGQLFVTSEPGEAEIELDGIALPQKTPALLERVPVGDHSLVVRKEGYVGRQTVKVVPGGIARVELKLEPLPAVLNISSQPFNARVSIDGADVGLTPLMKEVPPGAHKVRMVLRGHVPVEHHITVKPGESQRIAVTLRPAARLDVRVEPYDAQVTLDNEPLEPRPWWSNIAPVVPAGVHKLRVTHSSGDYGQAEQEVSLQPGEVHNVSVRLERTVQGRAKRAEPPKQGESTALPRTRALFIGAALAAVGAGSEYQQAEFHAAKYKRLKSFNDVVELCTPPGCPAVDSKGDRDRGKPRGSPLPHHPACGSAPGGSAS
ncbi:MAG: PEGA domain-containing protein [Candidatus Lambdaproteobacteria bacterium]|nr:PEGA domain-containing protein [Candidatus Lambdaproteobacteria bacterium]